MSQMLPAADSSVPNLDHPIGTASDEYRLVVVIPGDTINGHVVCVVGVEEGAGVGFWTDVYPTLFSANEEKVIFQGMEVECRSTAYKNPS